MNQNESACFSIASGRHRPGAHRDIGKWLAIYADLRKFRALQAKSNFEMPFGKLYPCIDEYNTESGIAAGQYFHQDLLIAQRIFEAKPARHVDVASRIDGFVRIWPYSAKSRCSTFVR